MKKRRNKKLIIVILLLAFLIIGGAYYLHLHPFWANHGTQAEDGKTDYAGQYHIEQYISTNDMDEDGIDDQTDMLQSTRDYVATKPKYKSKYYAGGYPDDGCLKALLALRRTRRYISMQQSVITMMNSKCPISQRL